MKLLRALDVAAADLQRPVLCWVIRKTHRSGIELAGLDVVPILVGLTAAKHRSLDLYVVVHVSQRDYAISNVRGVEPVMRDRRFRVVLAREAVHERRRAERGLTRQRDIREDRAALGKRMAVGSRELDEKVMRMLPIDERSSVGGLARLQQ